MFVERELVTTPDVREALDKDMAEAIYIWQMKRRRWGQQFIDKVIWRMPENRGAGSENDEGDQQQVWELWENVIECVENEEKFGDTPEEWCEDWEDVRFGKM